MGTCTAHQPAFGPAAVTCDCIVGAVGAPTVGARRVTVGRAQLSGLGVDSGRLPVCDSCWHPGAMRPIEDPVGGTSTHLGVWVSAVAWHDDVGSIECDQSVWMGDAWLEMAANESSQAIYGIG